MRFLFYCGVIILVMQLTGCVKMKVFISAGLGIFVGAYIGAINKGDTGALVGGILGGVGGAFMGAITNKINGDDDDEVLQSAVSSPVQSLTKDQ